MKTREKTPPTAPTLTSTPAPATTNTSTSTPTPTPVQERPAVAFEPEPVKHRPKKAKLSVNAIPWANLFVDGRAMGHTPRLGIALEAGKHHLKLVTRAGETRTRTVDLSPGQDAKVTVMFAEP
jgi:hypothetical protein